MKKITLPTALIVLIVFLSLPSYGQEPPKAKGQVNEIDLSRRALWLDSARTAVAARVALEYKTAMEVLASDSSLNNETRGERIKQLDEIKDARLFRLRGNRQKTPGLEEPLVPDSTVTGN